MIDEAEFWRLSPAMKVESVARDIDRLAARARAASLSVTAYMLEMAAQETRKELNRDDP